MSAQKGKDLLLKVKPDPLQGFITVAGMRSRRVTINAQSVDVTDFESTGRWRQLLAGAGLQRVSIAGSGIFKDTESDQQIQSLFFAAAIVDWLVVFPDFGDLSGPFQIVSLEYGGEHGGEMTFEMTLESAGAMAFTAAA